jgi:hypothetical protein
MSALSAMVFSAHLGDKSPVLALPRRVGKF